MKALKIIGAVLVLAGVITAFGTIGTADAQTSLMEQGSIEADEVISVSRIIINVLASASVAALGTLMIMYSKYRRVNSHGKRNI